MGGDKRVLSFEFQLGVVVVVSELAKQHNGLEISKQDGGGSVRTIMKDWVGD